MHSYDRRIVLFLKMAKWCDRSDVIEVMWSKWCDRIDVIGVMWWKWCAPSDVLEVMWSKWCARSDVLEVMWSKWCARSDVIEVMWSKWCDRSDVIEVMHSKLWSPQRITYRRYSTLRKMSDYSADMSRMKICRPAPFSSVNLWHFSYVKCDEYFSAYAEKAVLVFLSRRSYT